MGLKESLFEVSTVMSSINGSSWFNSILQFCATAIHFLIFVAFLLCSRTSVLWSSSSYIIPRANILEYIYTPFWLHLSESDTMLTIFLSMIGLITVSLVVYIYLACKLQEKSSSVISIYTLKIFCFSFQTILFLPINTTLFSMACLANQQDDSMDQIINGMICWSDSTLPFNIIAIIFLIIFNLLVLISLLSFFDFLSHSNSPTARANSAPLIVLLTLEGILLAVCNLYPYEYFEIFCLGPLLVGSMSLLYVAVLRNPFYGSLISNLWALFSIFLTVMSIVLVITAFEDPILNEYELVTLVIGFLFGASIFMTQEDIRFSLGVLEFDYDYPIKQSFFPKKALIRALERYGDFTHEFIANYKHSISEREYQEFMKTGTHFNQLEMLLLHFAKEKFKENISKYPGLIHTLQIYYFWFLVEKCEQLQEIYNTSLHTFEESVSFTDQLILFTLKSIAHSEIHGPQITLGTRMILP